VNNPSPKPIRRPRRIELRFLEGVRRRVPGHEPVLQALGHLYTRVGRYEDGLQVDLELTKLQPDNPQHWYNLGCSYALVGNRSKAFEALHRAVDLGYHDADWMRQDEDLASLRDDPSFEALLARAKSRPRWNDAE
jgi:predicted Zn-dependent protease